MRKIALVARREYMENVRTKGFWIGVLAFPLILALSVVVPILLIGTKQARTYAVIDHSGFVLKEVEKGILAEDLGIVLRARRRAIATAVRLGSACRPRSGQPRRAM